MSIKEKRYVNPEKSFRVEQNTEGQTVISGYASVFNRKSKLIFEQGRFFYETIERSAFDEVLSKPETLNVVLTYNHERSKILARTISKTLVLSTDDYGLRYDAVLPDTQLARDLTALIKRGDIFESSFVFSVDKEGERWNKTEEGWTRKVVSVNGLYDTALVVDGAYSGTDMKLTERQLQIIDNPENSREIKNNTTKMIKHKRNVDEVIDDLEAMEAKIDEIDSELTLDIIEAEEKLDEITDEMPDEEVVAIVDEVIEDIKVVIEELKAEENTEEVVAELEGEIEKLEEIKSENTEPETEEDMRTKKRKKRKERKERKANKHNLIYREKELEILKNKIK